MSYMPPFLITGDIHLSPKPKDEYRFGIFPWLLKQARKHKVRAIYILGDLTENKDNHPASLVNRIADELTNFDYPVRILMGNHDFVHRGCPFFKFLGYYEQVDYITEVDEYDNFTCIPHQPDQRAFDQACSFIPYQGSALLHQTISGAIDDGGNRHLNGLGASLIAQKQLRHCYSGDIHRPQVCGPVTYVGAPYQVRFGDDYTPRVLLISSEKTTDLHFPAPRKHSWVLSDLEELRAADLKAGDQVKLTLALNREEIAEWPNLKQRALDMCKELGVEVYGVTLKMKAQQQPSKAIKRTAPNEVFNEFCTQENVSSVVKRAGEAFIKEEVHD